MSDFYEEFGYEKRIIGKLIYYYRRKRNLKIDSLLYNKGSYYFNFCQDCNKCKKTERICSIGTLYKIEKGETLVKNECYYYRLCENLNKKYDFDEKMFMRLKEYQELLYGNLLHFSKNNLKSISTRLEKDLVIYKNSIYISEVLSLYLNMVNYMLYKKVPEKQLIDVYIYLKKHVNELDKKIILLLLFYMSKEFVHTGIDRKETIDECAVYFDDLLFYDVKLSNIVDKNFLESFSILEEEGKKELNEYQQLIVAKYKGYVYLNSGLFENCYDQLTKCLNILTNSTNLSDIEHLECFRRLGIVCFVLGKHDECINYYKKVLDANISLGINYCLYFNALEVRNRKEEIISVLSRINNIIDNKNMNEKIVLDYYREKYLHGELTKERIQILEKYILYSIKPIFEIMGVLQKKIFISDMKDYVKRTGNYKFLYQITDIQHDNIDDI